MSKDPLITRPRTGPEQLEKQYALGRAFGPTREKRCIRDELLVAIHTGDFRPAARAFRDLGTVIRVDGWRSTLDRLPRSPEALATLVDICKAAADRRPIGDLAAALASCYADPCDIRPIDKYLYPSFAEAIVEAHKAALTVAPEWSRPESPKVLARLLQCDPKTFKRWVAQGRYRVHKKSTRRWSIDLSDLPADVRAKLGRA
jgi:hypothetical protein